MVTINTMTMQNVPSVLAVSMALVMRRYYTAHIAWWRRFVAFIKATKRRHWASTRSNSIQPDMQMPVDSFISSWKKAPVDMLAPTKNRSVTYQTDGNHISKTIGYLVGVVKLAWYSLNTRLLLRVFTNNHLIYILIGSECWALLLLQIICTCVVASWSTTLSHYYSYVFDSPRCLYL